MSAAPAPCRWLRVLPWLPVVVVLAVVACSRPTVTVVPAADPKPAAAQEVPTGPPLFVDRTPGSGIEFTYRNGEEHDHFAIIESLGGGVALFDFDGDGKLDIFVTGGGDFIGPDGKT